MKKISFDGVGEVVATFAVGEDVTGGQVVKVTENATVGLCQAGDKFCGVALIPRAGFGGVQVKGFMTVRYSGALSLGKASLVADGTGGVKAAENGVEALVVNLDGEEAEICL
jgi:hypothetical protein